MIRAYVNLHILFAIIKRKKFANDTDNQNRQNNECTQTI